MREIKFRLRFGKVVVGYEKWYSGHDDGILSASPQWLYSKDGRYWNPGYIEHSGKDEFAGCQSKDGHDVYEGDIVRFHDEVGRVFWHGQGWDISPQMHFNPAGCLGGQWSRDIEVIGNIYENPELLGE